MPPTHSMPVPPACLPAQAAASCRVASRARSGAHVVTWPEQKAFLQSWLQMGTKRSAQLLASVRTCVACLLGTSSCRWAGCTALPCHWLAGSGHAAACMRRQPGPIRPVHDHTGRQSLTHIPHLE